MKIVRLILWCLSTVAFILAFGIGNDWAIIGVIFSTVMMRASVDELRKGRAK